MNIGSRIIDLREEKDLSQRGLAQELGLDRSVLNRIELGTRPLRDDELVHVAQYFHVSTDYLLGLTDARTSDAPPPAEFQLTRAEKAFILRYRLLTGKQKRLLAQLVEMVLSAMPDGLAACREGLQRVESFIQQFSDNGSYHPPREEVLQVRETISQLTHLTGEPQNDMPKKS